MFNSSHKPTLDFKENVVTVCSAERNQSDKGMSPIPIRVTTYLSNNTNELRGSFS